MKLTITGNQLGIDTALEHSEVKTVDKLNSRTIIATAGTLISMKLETTLHLQGINLVLIRH